MKVECLSQKQNTTPLKGPTPEFWMKNVKYNDNAGICNKTLAIYPFCFKVSQRPRAYTFESHTRAKRTDESGAETPRNYLCPIYMSLLAV